MEISPNIKVYVIFIDSGEYDDWSLSIYKIYLNRLSAEKYLNKKNKQLAKLKVHVNSKREEYERLADMNIRVSMWIGWRADVLNINKFELKEITTS